MSPAEIDLLRTLIREFDGEPATPGDVSRRADALRTYLTAHQDVIDAFISAAPPR